MQYWRKELTNWKQGSTVLLIQSSRMLLQEARSLANQVPLREYQLYNLGPRYSDGHSSCNYQGFHLLDLKNNVAEKLDKEKANYLKKLNEHYQWEKLFEQHEPTINQPNLMHSNKNYKTIKGSIYLFAKSIDCQCNQYSNWKISSLAEGGYLFFPVIFFKWISVSRTFPLSVVVIIKFGPNDQIMEE